MKQKNELSLTNLVKAAYVWERYEYDDGGVHRVSYMKYNHFAYNFKKKKIYIFDSKDLQGSNYVYKFSEYGTKWALKMEDLK